MGRTFNAIGAAILGFCAFKDGGEGFSVKLGKTSLIQSLLGSLGNYLTELLSNLKQLSLGLGIKPGFSANLGKYLVLALNRLMGDCTRFTGSVHA